ncbi:MAG: carboxypeptidase-like regulatory domain-containing protein [Bacteroidales bacterium]|nr:carboxypeptidase-like regulatory domain-containing protein [Bacteroidales bacterium]
MRMYHHIVFLFLLIHLSGLLLAQKEVQPSQALKERLVQFSGVVVTADSLRPVPFTHIMVKQTRWGAVADYYGYFSFVARAGDTVLFTSVGYKKSSYTIPDTISRSRYTLIKTMISDTIMLDETVIYPWPTKEQFREAFVKMDIPQDDLERARINLARAEMKERAMQSPMDGSMNYKNYMYWETYKHYYIGQTQPITILDPFAWAQFFKAWKEGKFKRQK